MMLTTQKNEYDLVCVGISHHKTSIDIRERIALSGEELSDHLFAILKHNCIKETVILNTCNRLEVYACGDLPAVISALADLLQKNNHTTKDILYKHIYSYVGSEALNQLFRVSCSLDAQLIGEPQILGQVKNAYQNALSLGATGPLLNKVFAKAFQTAKQVRRETKIGHSPISISYAAVKIAEKIFSNVNNLQCMLIGAGEMCEKAAINFAAHGANLHILNRTFSRAQKLASRYHDAKAYQLADIDKVLLQADIALSCVSAANYTITTQQILSAQRQRRYKPLLLLDIAVPRNIQPQVNKIEGVYLYNIDELNAIIKKNIKKRHLYVEQAQKIIDQAIRDFSNYIKEQQCGELVAKFKYRSNQIAKEQVQKTLSILNKSLNNKQINVVEDLSVNIANKIAHEYITQVKQVYSCEKIANESLQQLNNILG